MERMHLRTCTLFLHASSMKISLTTVLLSTTRGCQALGLPDQEAIELVSAHITPVIVKRAHAQLLSLLLASQSHTLQGVTVDNAA